MTEAGRAAFRYAEIALDALDQILPEVNATRNVVSGKLILGISDNLIGNPGSRLHATLDALRQAAPQVEIAIHTLTTNQMLKALLDRRLDIAIKGVYERDPSLEYRELFEETHKIYYADDPEDTSVMQPSQRPMVFRAVQPFVERALNELGYTRGPEAIGLESVALFIATGYYVGILPVHYARMLKNCFPLKEVPGTPTYGVKFCAVTNPSRPLSRAVEKLLELL